MVGLNSFRRSINTHSAVQLKVPLASGDALVGQFCLSAQSGAFGMTMLHFAAQCSLILFDFVSTDNRADVSDNDVMQFWIDDDFTKAVGFYLKSEVDGKPAQLLSHRPAAVDTQGSDCGQAQSDKGMACRQGSKSVPATPRLRAFSLRYCGKRA